MAEQKFSIIHKNQVEIRQDVQPNLAAERQRGDKQQFREKLRQEGARIAQAHNTQRSLEEQRKSFSKDNKNKIEDLSVFIPEEEELRRKNRALKLLLDISDKSEKERKIEAAALAARSSPIMPTQPPLLEQTNIHIKNTSKNKLELNIQEQSKIISQDNSLNPTRKNSTNTNGIQDPFIEKFHAVFEKRLILSQNANELYQAMRGGATGVGTDEKRLFKALEGRDPMAVREIRQIYFDHYGRELERDLKAELKGDKRYINRLMPLLEGDLLHSDVAGVRLQIELPIHDKKEIIRILAAQDQSMLPKFIDTYRSKYGSELIKDLAPILTDIENKSIKALLDNEREKFQAFQIQNAIANTQIDSIEIQNIVKNSQADLTKIQSIYLEEFNQTITESLKNKISIPQNEIITALLNNEPLKAASVNIHDILLSSNTPLIDIQNILRELPVDQRKLIFQIYHSQYGNTLLVDIKDRLELDPIRQNLVEKIVSGINLNESEHIALIFAELIPQKKFDQIFIEINQSLQNKTKEEIRVLGNELKLITGSDLKTFSQLYFNGAQKFDLSLSLHGRPTTLEEEHRLALARYEYERMKLNAASAHMIDLLSDQGRILDNTARRVTEQYRRLTKVDSAPDEANELRFYGLLDFLDHDVRNYRDAKNALARFISNSSALLIGLFGFIVSARSGYGFIASLATAALFGGVSKGILHSYLTSRSLSGESIVEELNKNTPKKGSRVSRRIRKLPLRKK